MRSGDEAIKYLMANNLTINFNVLGAFMKSTIIGEKYGSLCWDLRLEKLSKSLSKIMISAEGVESKHSTSLKHQE